MMLPIVCIVSMVFINAAIILFSKYYSSHYVSAVLNGAFTDLRAPLSHKRAYNYFAAIAYLCSPQTSNLFPISFL